MKISIFTLAMLFVVSSLGQTAIFSDSFMGNFPDSWYVGNDGGITGTSWGNNSFKSSGDGWSVFCADNGSNSANTYPNNLKTYMQRQNISLIGYSTATLSFEYYGSIEANFDFITVNIRNQYNQWFEVWKKSGTFSTWETQTLDLSSFCGQSGLYIQFRFDSDGRTTSQGIWIDKIKLSATTAAKPDLIIKEYPTLSSSSVNAGSSVTVSYELINQGGATAGASYTSFHLSSKNYFDGSSQFLADNSATSLNAGSSKTYTKAVTIPENTPAGNYYILVSADGDGDVTESNESNQTTYAAITVTNSNNNSQIQWSGYPWDVRSGTGNPGSNNWSKSTSNVWVDPISGELHLKITNNGGKWYCAEISSVKSFGYGEYTFQLSSRIDQLQKNIVLGLFTYKYNGVSTTPQENEIDIEFSRWNNDSNPNSQYGFQYRPPNSGNLIQPYSFETTLNGPYSTHKFIWSKGNILFQSYHGNSANLPSNDYLICPAQTFSDNRIPVESSEKVVLNLYLFQGNILPNQQEAEVIIKSFTFKPIQPTINITSPLGGENWVIGEKKTITWNSSNLTGRVNIEIKGDPNRDWDPLEMNSINDGSHEFVVDGTEGSAKKIRISSVSNPNIKTESGNFSFIKSSQTIVVTSPVGNEEWPINSLNEIKWTTSKKDGFVNIEINGNYPNGKWETIKNGAANTGTYSYFVDGMEGNAKRIRVSYSDKPMIYGESENFAFTPSEATIDVKSPNGDEPWEIGSTKTIVWETKNLVGNVTIEVNGNYPDGKWEIIEENIPNTHSYNYKVDGTPGSQKRIRVKSVANQIISDISDDNFNFVPKPITETNSIIDILVWLANSKKEEEVIENSNLYKLYYDDKEPKKVYGFISGRLSPNSTKYFSAGVKLGVKVFIDLDDYYSAGRAVHYPNQIGITNEGKEGQWVTMWVDADISTGIGVGLPIGIGYTSPENIDNDIPDSKIPFDFRALNAKLLFYELGGLESNEDGTVWKPIGGIKEIPSLSLTFDEIGFNLYKFEIKKDALDQIVNKIMIGQTNNGLIDLTNNSSVLNTLISSFFSTGLYGNIIINPDLSGKLRPFSSTDNNKTGVDGVINYLYPINRKDANTNDFQVVPITFSKLPLNENDAVLTFQNIGNEPADFVVKVSNVPEGWFVGATDDNYGLINNSYTFNKNDNSYEFSNVLNSDDPRRFEATFWKIACLNTAPDEADLTFELFYKRSLLDGKKALDSKKIRVKKQKSEGNNNVPRIVPISPSSNVNLGSKDELVISWSDSDSDNNASIAIALDPDILGLTPWEGKENHFWIANNIKEDDDGSDGHYIFDTEGYPAGNYSLWSVIWDGFNEPYYAKSDGIINISLFDNILPYSLINSEQIIWKNSNSPLDINFFDNLGLNTTLYQVVSASSLKSADNAKNENLLFNVNESEWNSLTSNGTAIMTESTNNLTDSLTADWKISNRDWESISTNNQDLEKHYIFLKATDDAGNVYITPDINSAFELKIDIHSPNVIILSPREGQNFESSTVEINWNADDIFNDTQLSGLDTVLLSIDQSADFIRLAGDVTNFTFKNLNNGVHTIYVKVKDKAGNYSELKHVEFTINSAIQLPDIKTTNVSLITLTDAIGGGIVIDSKGVEIIEKGVCWGSSINPTISLETKTSEGKGSGMFTSSMRGLEAGNTYHVRAYATNIAGTAYGNDVSFTTLQNDESKTLSVSTTSITLDSDINSSSSFTITSNTNWSIVKDQSWLRVYPTSGSNNGNIILTANSNNTSALSRSCILTVSGGGITKSITVTQSKKPVEYAQISNPTVLLIDQASLKSEKYYQIHLSANVLRLSIKIIGNTGNCEMYVSHNEEPTIEDYQYHDYSRSSNELVKINNPDQGEWNILLYGGSTYMNVSLQVYYELIVEDCDHSIEPQVVELEADDINALLTSEGIANLTGNYFYYLQVGSGTIGSGFNIVSCFDGVLPIAGFAKGYSSAIEDFRVQFGNNELNKVSINSAEWVNLNGNIFAPNHYFFLDGSTNSSANIWFSTIDKLETYNYGFASENDSKEPNINLICYTEKIDTSSSGLDIRDEESFIKAFFFGNTIVLENPKKQNLTITIYDVYGKIVFCKEMEEQEINIDLTKRTGFYLIQVLDQDNHLVLSRKFVL